MSGFGGADGRRAQGRAMLGDVGQSRPLAYASALALVAAACALGLLMTSAIAIHDIALLLVVPVMATAIWLGRGPSMVAAAASVVGFDYLFVPPRFAFAVADPRYGITFAIMLGIGFVIGGMASRLREQGRAATEREAKTDALYSLGRALESASTDAAIAGALVSEVERVFRGEARWLARPPGLGEPHASRASLVAQAVAERRTQRGAGAIAVPLDAGDASHGVLLLVTTHLEADAIDVALLEALARQAAAAFARAHAADVAAAADRRARAEEARNTLLSAVSHDLRTPLAVIGGAATTVRTAALLPDERDELLATICDEAERLERLVGNLLDMTRLQSGVVALRGQWMPLVEVVGSALGRLDAVLGDRRVDVELDPGLPLVWIDPVLLEQALVNLVDNARKHTPPGEPITVSGHVERDAIVVAVADRGPGLVGDLAEHAFDRFVRGDPGRRDGFGLGLAICREIAAIHGGTISAEPREGGGLRVVLVLPRIGDAPSVEIEEASA
jgi:two-component system sensor histidine kinase KdpD